MAKTLDKVLVKLLRCPLTGAALVQEGDELVTQGTPSVRYPILDGRPILVPAAARRSDDAPPHEPGAAQERPTDAG